MTFLEICQRVRSEAGISGGGPVHVVGQTGIHAKIVDWVKTAHQEIQLSSNRWRFDWAELTTSISTNSYDASALGVRDWDWNSLYVDHGSRTWLSAMDWDTYRKVSYNAGTGIPTGVSLAPDKTLRFYPTPFEPMTFGGEYYKVPEVLANTTDVPRMPVQYHMAIVWRALMLYCSHDENIALFQVAKINYDSILLKMQVTELDGPAMPEALV